MPNSCPQYNHDDWASNSLVLKNIVVDLEAELDNIPQVISDNCLQVSPNPDYQYLNTCCQVQGWEK